MTAVPEDPGRIAVHAAVIPAAAAAPLSNQAYGRPPSPRAASCAWNPTSPRSPPCLSRPGSRSHCSSSGGTTLQARSRRLRPVQLLQACSAACAAFLMAWIMFLSAALPAQAVAHEWKLAWIGLDVAEAAGLLVVTWAARRPRETLIPAAIVTGTLLACDAWFDVILSWGTSDWRWSALSAVAVELPLATLLFAAARQMTKTTDAGLTARRGAWPAPRPPAPALAAGADAWDGSRRTRSACPAMAPEV
jgi:hypothetical protein